MEAPWTSWQAVFATPRPDARLHGPLQRSTGCSSAPRKRAVGSRMQLALGEPRKAERLKQRALLAPQLLRHELAHADHFITVIGVGNDIDVLAEKIEHRKIVRREAAEPARVLFPLVDRD